MRRMTLHPSFVKNEAPPAPTDRPRQKKFIETLDRGVALVFVVSYGGSRTFSVLTYRSGKPYTKKLGNYPALSLQDARQQALAYWRDPKAFEAKGHAQSFPDVAQEWLNKYVGPRGLRSEKALNRQLQKYVYPRWQKRTFVDVRRNDVANLVDEIGLQHGTAQANHVLATVRGIMSWYQSRNEDYTSPIVRGMGLPKAEARDRVLKDSEIAALWSACEDMGNFGTILKLLLLTAQRRESVAQMQWADIRGDEWHVAQPRRAKGTGGILKLPPPALEILRQQPRVSGNPFVFASGAEKHFNSWSQNKSVMDSRLGFEKPWVVHDLRRTSRSLMSKLGLSSDIAERVLGHTRSGVEPIYDRHQYIEEKADALRKLASYVATICKNVGLPIRVFELISQPDLSNEDHSKEIAAA